MILIALQQNWPLLVNSDSYAVVEAFLAKPSATFLIVEILTVLLAAAHAAEAVFYLHIALMTDETVFLKIVLITACAISVDIHKFTSQAVPLATVIAPFGTLLLLLAQLALRRLMHFI